MFKKGDKVYSVVWGWGYVEDLLDPSHKFPVLVKYPDAEEAPDVSRRYMSDGRSAKGTKRTIFFAEIPIPPEALERPESFEVDDLVWVRSTECGVEELRYVSHFENRTIYCFAYGATSLTVKKNPDGTPLTHSWRHWRRWEEKDETS